MTAPPIIPGYRILKTLGDGGMATVYLALQESLDREVALKVMSPVLAANPNFCEQFIKEGRITAKLTHPHLVTVHDIGSHQNTFYLASEYVPAGTLRERMTAGLHPSEALDIAREVAAGLAFAHEKGFVHRDVKPGNILFRANGSAVLADFGIAKAMTSISAATIAGHAIGTPDYMSPEQAQAGRVDGRSDLYGLGAVLYEMLTGSKPYRADDPYGVALKHVTEPVPRLPDQLAWLQPLIDGLMAKKPEARYATGDAFIAACDQLVQANPQGIALREQRSTRKRAALRMQVAPMLVSPSPDVESSPPRNRTRYIVAASGVLALILIGAAAVRWSPFAPINPPAARPESPPVSNPESEPATTPPDASAGLETMAPDALLARAEEYMAKGKQNDERISYPPGDNALDLFRETLKRDPANARAKDGLRQIEAFYESGARTAFKLNLLDGADELAAKGLRADPDNAALRKLRDDIASTLKAQKDSK